MKGIYDHLSAWLHRKESEKFGLDAFGKTAVRVIGNLTATIAGLTVKTPFTQNVAMPIAGNEYSVTVPINTKRFVLKCRGISKLQYAFISGTTNTVFSTLSPGAEWREENMVLTAALTIYFQATKPNEVLELVSWTD